MAPRLELNFPNPVEGEADLFDRKAELELIRETIASSSRRIAVIMGERVTGKTSLLNVVQAWANAEPGLAVLRLAPVTLRSKLIEEILEGMASEADTSLYGLGYRDKSGGFTRSTVVGFAAVAAELSAQAARMFVVCLDELDSMLVNCPDDQSANEILDFIMYVSNASLPIRFIFTLTRATPQIMRADSTPFITAARIADLTPWTKQETREFVEWLMSPSFCVDDAAHDLLFAEGGGHPYLTKAILQRIVDDARADPADNAITADRVHGAVAAALVAPEVHLTLKNILNAHISPDELHILQRLAKTARPLAVGEFASAMPAVNEMCRRHYVRSTPVGYVLAFRLLGRWLLAQASADTDDPRGVDDNTVAKLVIDENRRRVYLGDREVQLSQYEYRLLQRLAADPGTVIDRATLAAAVWPDESSFEGGRDSGRLSQLVHRLRSVLDDHERDAKYIETRRGLGISVVPQNVERIPRGGP